MTNKEAINVLRRQVMAYGDTLSEAEHKAFDKAIEALERTRWRDAKTEPPEESGEYFVFCKVGYQSVLSYSTRYKAFNAQDTEEEPLYPIEVTHWMPMPEEPKEEV